ncbi:PAS domain S-box protein [Tundrisphaera lichenicola]|uniref:PAS domain S-box protein n=1 Tax=Tundrisphaera lichenicola TaxID=2029860 RepID=UPI003EBE64EB
MTLRSGQAEALPLPVAEVLESIADAFFALDRAWNFSYLNRAAERLLQRSRLDLIGHCIWDEFPEAVGLNFHREYNRAVEQGVTVQFEEYFAPLATWFEVRASPTPAGLSVYFQDVNERRAMEEALRDSEQRHRALFETMEQGVVYQDAQGRIEYANPAASRILAMPIDAIIGRNSLDHAWQAFHEDGSHFPTREHPAMIALATGKPFQSIVMELHRPETDEVRWIRINAVPIFREGSDRPYRVQSVFEDITEQKRSEKALRRSEQRYRSLVDASSAIVWATDAHGSIVSELPSWEAFTGQSPDQYLGKGWLDAVHPLDRERVETVWLRSVTERSPYDTEYRIRHRAGGHRLVIARGVPVANADGTLDEWVGTCEDVTEQRQSLASLRQAKEEAERANRAKDDFIAVLSHELRTPLTPVLLTISMMEAHSELPPDLREDVASIRRNVELESRLIGDLLDLTRIAKGKLELKRKVVDLHHAIRVAIEICQREEAIRLVPELNAERHIVQGDSTRLQQVFWNLINNAQKFSREGGEIRVRTSNPDLGKVRVEVIDNGVGIDPEVLPRLFDAFEQGDVRSNQSFAGLGLGLAISRKLVNAHGGKIDAISPGKGLGATFTVEIETIDHPSREASSSSITTIPKVVDEPMTVLLVEDHDATQRILARLLGRLGHRVTPVSSVAAALAVCTQHHFDLILSDLGLPDGSGLDLMRRLGTTYQGRAVALTGYGMESDIRASRDAGFAEHLIKPVDLDSLKTTITRVIAASKGRTDPIQEAPTNRKGQA